MCIPFYNFGNVIWMVKQIWSLDLCVKGQNERWNNNFHLTASGGVYLGKSFSN